MKRFRRGFTYSHLLPSAVQPHRGTCLHLLHPILLLLELERILRKSADKKNKKPGISIYCAKFLAESLCEIEYVNPYGKTMSVMLRTDYDEEVMKLLDAIGLKS